VVVDEHDELRLRGEGHDYALRARGRYRMHGGRFVSAGAIEAPAYLPVANAGWEDERGSSSQITVV
jgi:hypothetical protein